MICANRKCHKEIPDGYTFCPYCGRKQSAVRHKKRPNGSGSIFKRSDVKSSPWVAVTPATTQYDRITDTVKRSRQIIGSYRTQAEAQAALDAFKAAPVTDIGITLEQLHDLWQPFAYKKISKQLQDNYNAAWYKLRPLYKSRFCELRASDYQAVIDYYDADHPKEGVDGKVILDSNGHPVIRPALSRSSLHKIKVLLGSLYKYAIKEDYANKNYAEYIELPESGDAAKDRFTDVELEKIRQSSDPVADLIYIMCYTGHRIGEFVSMTSENVRYVGDSIVFYGGNKTFAGQRKVVPVHRKIRERVERWISMHGETIFCRPDGRAWTADNLRDHISSTLSSIGVRPLTPHACRRTFATRLSASGASPADIIALMGHSDFDVDLDHYINQETTTLIDALNKMA